VKLKNLSGIPDGFFQTACQQTCPADAITFGNLSDTATEYPAPGGAKRVGSRVVNQRENGRSYLLLGYLNTRPRTTHMVAIRNPNPALVGEGRKSAWKNPFQHGHEGGHPSEGGPQHEAGHGEKAAMGNVFDKTRLNEDRGYRLSLSVIGVDA
jgi:hypothetical protein